MGSIINGREAQGSIINGVVQFRNDGWLPVTINPAFSGTPVLMHHDVSTGITTFIGGVSMPWSQEKGVWTGTFMTLPDGYKFTKVPAFDVYAGSNPDNSAVTASSVSGRSITLSMRYRWDNGGKIFFLFGSLYWFNDLSVWTTDAISLV